MEFEPKQKNKVPDILCAALLFCAVVCMVFGNVRGIAGRSILQTVALGFFAAFVFVLVKYKFTRVRYVIRKKAKKGYGDEEEETEDDNAPVISCPPESLELLIETAQGKRTFIGENLVALEKIEFFGKLPEQKSEKKALSEKFSKIPCYKYLKNVVGTERYLLVASSEVGRMKIIFEPSGKMAEYLSAVSAYNKDHEKEN